MMEEGIKNRKWDREKTAEVVTNYEKKIAEIVSQRQYAEEQGVARTTLQHWLKRKNSIEHEQAVVKFFESPDGLAALHEIVMAAEFVIEFVGAGGIRLDCLFLELSRLDRFVASSYGSQQKVSTAMEKEIVEYGTQQREKLSKGMKPKEITVTEDETFHPEICLVAIEPVSNFILLEKYTDKRDAGTWNKAMEEALCGLPVKVFQSTSDEGKAILSHVEDGLGVHHSPDLCHVQSSLIKGTSLALASNKRQAEKACQKALEQTNKIISQQQEYETKDRGRGRPANFEKRIEQAHQLEEEAKERLAKATAQQQEAQSAIQAIGLAYHPFDLETGQARSAEEISAILEKHFREIKRIATDAELPSRCKKLIDKARKVIVQLVATIAFFHQTVTAKVEALSLPPSIERVMYQNLIPAFYIQMAARKATTAQQKRTLEESAQRLLAPLKEESNPLSGLNAEDRKLVEKVAKECAEVFQRSSSCVEGRNGQLSFRHHCLHKIRTQKLKALTVVHNYFIKRPDGTTAAERFFGAKPADLFQWLLDHIDLPARPAKKRSLLRAA